jgi:acetyl esterase/lipase
MKKRLVVLCVALLLVATLIFAQTNLNFRPQESALTTYKIYENISYKAGNNLSDYEKERCKLDLYVPEKAKDFPTLVFFHGGSLKSGSKDADIRKAMAKRFTQDGIAVAVVNYRLFPQVKYPSYINDAAAAVAWVMTNISKYDGSPKAVFVCGYSAGAYLTLMLGFVPPYLQEYHIDRMSIAGLIPIAGQTFTHSTIREERGIPNPGTTPFIDEAAPCYNARKDTPPMLVVWGDGDAPVTIAQNKYLIALLNSLENKNVSFFEVKDHDHMQLATKIAEPNNQLAREIINFISNKK